MSKFTRNAGPARTIDADKLEGTRFTFHWVDRVTFDESDPPERITTAHWVCQVLLADGSMLEKDVADIMNETSLSAFFKAALNTALTANSGYTKV